MSLPLKNDPAETTDRLPREDVGPKLIAMESYDSDIDVADAAAEEVEAVLLRASESLPRAKPFHEAAESLASASRGDSKCAGIGAPRCESNSQPWRKRSP